MPETGPNGSTIISQCFIDQKYDIAWGLIQRFPRLTISRDHYGVTPLYALSAVPSAFPSGMQLNFWQRWIYECIKIQPGPLAGNDIYINVVNMKNDEGIQRDFHSDTSNNNMLHMAAMSSPFGQLTRFTGAALKMQRELQWFKEVETIVPPQYLENTNLTDYKRPRYFFFHAPQEVGGGGRKADERHRRFLFSCRCTYCNHNVCCRFHSSWRK